MGVFSYQASIGFFQDKPNSYKELFFDQKDGKKNGKYKNENWVKFWAHIEVS